MRTAGVSVRTLAVRVTARVRTMTETMKSTDQQPIRYHLWSNRHEKWWKPGALGYTADISLAGLYSWEDAVTFVTASSLSGDHTRVTCMVAAGRPITTMPEPPEEIIPPWADDLLRAFVCGSPLDFHGHSVPTGVRQRLEEALVSFDNSAEMPHLVAACAEDAALDLALRWMAVDPYYRDHPELTPREGTLVHLAMRCITRPQLVEKRLRELSASESRVVR
jgi:hypothetical protein